MVAVGGRDGCRAGRRVSGRVEAGLGGFGGGFVAGVGVVGCVASADRSRVCERGADPLERGGDDGEGAAKSFGGFENRRCNESGGCVRVAGAPQQDIEVIQVGRRYGSSGSGSVLVDESGAGGAALDGWPGLIGTTSLVSLGARWQIPRWGRWVL